MMGQAIPNNNQTRSFFNVVPEDILLNIFSKLGEDPRDLPRLACVCGRFAKLIRMTCCKFRCMHAVPSLITDIVEPLPKADCFSEPPGGWGALYNLLFCCPGLLHTGVLLENWDSALEREVRSTEGYQIASRVLNGTIKSSVTNGEIHKFAAGFHSQTFPTETALDAFTVTKSGVMTKSYCKGGKSVEEYDAQESEPFVAGIDDKSMQQIGEFNQQLNVGTGSNSGPSAPTLGVVERGGEGLAEVNAEDTVEVDTSQTRKHIEYSHGRILQVSDLFIPKVPEDTQQEFHGQSQTTEKEFYVSGKGNKRRKKSRRDQPHLASGRCNFSREQGNKLLANRFRDDSLYICDWPGCVHPGEKRNYKLFRGVFKKFKASYVWRNLNDVKAKRSNLRCAFCSCESTWDMVASFCLKRSIGSHEDGEPFVRAYVCDNGHVAGAWTDRPLYNL